MIEPVSTSRFLVTVLPDCSVLMDGQIETETGNGWRHLQRVETHIAPVRGWRAWWRRLRGLPLHDPMTFTMSAYVKGDTPVKLELWGPKVGAN